MLQRATCGMTPPTIHASAVLVGSRAVLIRGPSGAGKSSLARALIDAAKPEGPIRFARLIGDDRLHVAAANGRLLVRPAPALAGLIELRGSGIFRLPHEGCAVVGLVVDLAAADAARLPDGQTVIIEGIELPRLAVAPDSAALGAALAVVLSRIT